MEPLTLLIIVLVVHGVIMFFDMFLKSCMNYPYIAFLDGTGVTIKPFRLQWYTTAFNDYVVRLAHSKANLLSKAFDFGIYVSFFLMPVAIIILVKSAIAIGTDNSNVIHHNDDAIRLEVLIPGVNIPTNEFGYYITALVISSIVHELGHALAAVLADVPVTGFGLTIALIFPMAYTELSTEHLTKLEFRRKMRILCAGIWNNLLTAMSALAIYMALPIILYPFYSTNDAVMVTNIAPMSHLRGAKGIETHDLITRINGCDVNSPEDWSRCLLETIKHPPAYCITTNYFTKNDVTAEKMGLKRGSDCCPEEYKTHICFSHSIEPVYDLLSVPKEMCFDIRKTVENSEGYCHFKPCDKHYCIKPILPKSTTIIQFERKGKPNAIYMGHPVDALRTIEVSSYVPRMKFIPVSMAEVITSMLKYLIVFSMGLAIINVIPCYGLDGQFIVMAIINRYLARRVTNSSKREQIAFAVTWLGTILVMSTLVKVLINAFSS